MEKCVEEKIVRSYNHNCYACNKKYLIFGFSFIFIDFY
ncbi:hypothetical protein BSI_25870 [Bacillus inaquosorum KCTC 13429]|uniref:Uncharacterized protein n=1 Tax=Bacillus inaquosorum KCTC 13429 TaxID=1236548 RepID=A0A9W5LI54_9BACI|nr:hypothetical protein BSI_25870 [Bacillus inaquosorum KCTC 13429]